MKIKCYDKEQDMYLVLEFEELECDWFSSHRCGGSVRFTFETDGEKTGRYIEDPDVRRWSDLTAFEIIE